MDLIYSLFFFTEFRVVLQADAGGRQGGDPLGGPQAPQRYQGLLETYFTDLFSISRNFVP